jgi:hypothetical protein
MARSLSLFALLLPLLALPLTGCETKRIWVELPSFGDGTVDGVWLWRLDGESGEYVRQCQLPIGDVETIEEREAVYYDQDCGDAPFEWNLHAAVERSPEQPDTVRLGLWYMRWEDPGTYKLSAYGADGESALSDTTLEL